MTAAATLVGEFDSLLADRLGSLGFVRRSRNFVTVLESDVEGVVGYGRNSRTKGVAVWPVVGVRWLPLESLQAELLRLRVNQNIRTLGAPIGEVLPERRWAIWEIVDSSSARASAEEVAQLVELYALPAMKSVASPRAILDALRTSHRLQSQSVDYALPIALMMVGDNQAARDALDDGRSRRSHRRDDEAKAFISFAAELETRIPRP